ncbi:MAG: siroheme synthase CysG, partial [Porphyromonadaceae bacterium]|nr:siroheme synthase CysG [Porphyromonadaceae bacterium]
MAYFPMFIELQDAPVLIIGGGNVALRKVQKLLPYGAKITVIAPKMEKGLEEISAIKRIYRTFETSDLLPCPTMVIAATSQKEVNEQISHMCKERNIPVNVVDDVENCSFLFPALVKKGKLSAGICTGGASPTAAVYCKEKLQEVLPDRVEEILDWLEGKRTELKECVPLQSKRAGIFRELFDQCMEKGRPLTEEEWRQVLDGRFVGSVSLVGAGCGKADLITVRGLHLLQQCDVVVYDDLIDPKLLDSVPETAERIYMGKRSGHHSAPQEEINQTLIELAKQGKKVVRLKGGDPYLFGRGGEEMLALLKEGISCQEVPGIPSAIGIAAEAGIPVTHRGASRGLHIVTAHTTDTEDGLPEDFDALAQLSGTLVFLMGLRQLPKIVKRLLAAGKSGDTPAAVLSGGNSKNPARVRAKLSEIEAAAEKAGVSSPAIIMIGEVAALDFHAKNQLDEHVKIGITG